MGKNPTEAKKKGEGNKEPENILHIIHYIKANGNIGMKKFFKKAE